ncbi:MAG: flagellar motor switch protein FliN [Ruminococcus sp.]|nr:flagellar motor switch protein FliN [Ruminococcus sp.]
MSDENIVVEGFGDAEKDAIGEIMNITMGSAATAVSNMLSAKVWITTPTVSLTKAKELVYPELEPSIHVKIKYILGVSGDNVLVLKQDDVQLILNQLMGMPLEVTDDFEFDEMNISAVCEVMNQMMGASATALSELISTPIDISTPEAQVTKEAAEGVNPYGLAPDDEVCVIKFKLTIENVINSEFISVLSIPLAKEMADKMIASFAGGEEEETLSQDDVQAALSNTGGAAPEPPASSGGGALSQDEINAMLAGNSQPAPAPAPAAPAPAAPDMNAYQQPVQQTPQMPPMQGMPQMQQPMQPQQMPMQGMPPQGMPMQGMPMQGNPYGGYGMPQYGYPPVQPVPRGSSVNVQAVQLQSFDNYTNKDLTADQNDNLRLLMGVPLDVTVEIGSAKRKVKEILDFAQGTIIELERQAGAPVDIIVNGHLIARGDVVVIDDNFAVRITEIIKSKFLDNLGKE